MGKIEEKMKKDYAEKAEIEIAVDHSESKSVKGKSSNEEERELVVGDQCLVLTLPPNDIRRRSGGYGTGNVNIKAYVTIQEIRPNYNPNNPNIIALTPDGGRYSYYPYELKLIVKNKNYYLKKIQKYEEKMEDIKSKINFLEELNISEYSENKYKIFKGLKMSKGKSLGEKIETIYKQLK